MIPSRSTIAIAENLRRLCSYCGSVTEVCRQIGINRQQFTKYLSGDSFPSLRNLRRITDFFGVDEFEILLPPAEFVARVIPRRTPGAASLASLPAFLPPHSKEAQAFLTSYCGYYHVYFCTPVWSNHIVRALTRIHQQDGVTVSRSIERLRDHRGSKRAAPTQKFQGAVSQVVDRICIVEFETYVKELLSMTVLYPSHRYALRLLTGVMTGLASSGSRQPFASRVVYEYLGRKVDARAALAACGLFSLEDTTIAEDIRSRVHNEIAPGEGVLLPRPY